MSDDGKPQPVTAPLRAGVSSDGDDVQELLRYVHAELQELRRRRSPAVPLWFAVIGVWLLLLIQILVPVVLILAD